MTTCSPTADLRKLSPAELEQLGQQSLRKHLVAQAILARKKYGPLTADRLDTLLRDPDCLRYPVRIVYESGCMAPHQFAQPDMDWRNPEQYGRVLYVHPLLREKPELLPLAVAYMIPVINYGQIITDEHCLLYGSVLFDVAEDNFYEAICMLSEAVGAKPLIAAAKIEQM